MLASSVITTTVQSGTAHVQLMSNIITIPSGYKFAGATVVVTGTGSTGGYWQIIGFNGNLDDPAVIIKQSTGSEQTWRYIVYMLIVPS